MEHEIIRLLLAGKLPMEAVEPNLFPSHLGAVLKAVSFAIQRGDSFPLKPGQVWKIAQVRFNAGTEVHEFLKDVDSLETTPAVLESVCHNLLLRKLSALTTEQLATGEVDFDRLRKLLNVTDSKTEYIFNVHKPKQEVRDFILKTGIPALDRVIGGLNNELAIVAARPKHGKSNFFFNVIANNPNSRIVYITIADYGYDEVCANLEDIDPAICERDNLKIVDYTPFAATVNDVESAVADVRPAMVIVDRSEKLTPLRRRKEQRLEFADITDALRRIAKKYLCPILTDAQLSDGGNEALRQGRPATGYNRMAEDRTQRAAILDLFFGLYRGKTSVWITVQGRRKGLPQEVEIPTDTEGRYLI